MSSPLRAGGCGLAVLLCLTSSPVPVRAGQCWRVPASDGPQLESVFLRPVVREDYGSFVWLELDESDSRLLEAAQIRHTRVPGCGEVCAQGHCFDPLAEPRPAASRGRVDSGPGLVLIQFAAPPRDEWLSHLSAAGYELLQYYPHNVYLAWAGPRRQDLGGLAFVRWWGPLSVDDKLSPALTGRAGLIRSVTVMLVDDGEVAATMAALDVLGARPTSLFPAQPDRRVLQAVVEVDAGALDRIARLEPVIAVDHSPPGAWGDEMADSIVAGNHDDGVPEPGYLVWLDGLGSDGSGVIWAVNDTGVDFDHPDLGLVGGYSYPGCNSIIQGDEGVPAWGHGTPVAGIVSGDGAAGYADGDGFLYGVGVAPAVGLYSINMCGVAFPPPDGWQDLTRRGVAAGASGSNNDWIITGSGGYTAVSRSLDLMVRDGDFDTPDVAEPQILVFCAGNDGPGASTIWCQAEAKNVIVVGATDNYRAGDIEGLADFSSRGPAEDGRQVPTLVAPGADVASARNDTGGIMSPPEIAGTLGYYCMFSGTSAAAPHVSGALAVITEWWRTFHEGRDPSPAMAKALLVNAAVDIAGAPPVPDFDEGWGRVHLANVLRPRGEMVYRDQDQLLSETGSVWSMSMPVDPSRPLKVTLAWTDAPGAVGANPALVNDLDLRVTTGGHTYLGNQFADGWSIPGGSPDALNNLECVFVQTPGDSAVVTVEAVLVAGDGVPTNGDLTDQDFALVCTNCIENLLFRDGFESGNATAWSVILPAAR